MNLSYQDLGHRYQKENLIRILKRLIRVERLDMADNSLTDIQAVTFPRCTHLTLCMNYINSFQKLPKCPQLKELNLACNHIETLDGLNVLRKTYLESLDLRRNPVVVTDNYRYRVFQTLPNLKELDGIPKLQSDDYEEEYDDENDQSKCIIS
ncbi:acidic leucine-rich nuclear phosphoprotein 32-related protein-like [Ptychodera flava]|uniref:acidic leucine-rich nuclear phosphoprotein 32-related protein-like n=1 Tax=Ptychodera flava TaxID=63121 RepID=UPI003969C56C